MTIEGVFIVSFLLVAVLAIHWCKLDSDDGATKPHLRIREALKWR